MSKLSNFELSSCDSEIFNIIEDEKLRQHNGIELIASENYASPSVIAAMGSILTNKYAEGYPNHRYYGGCENVDKIEEIAIDRLKKLYKCNFANVQPHSGSQANFAVYTALLNPGDTVLGMNLSEGGHLTHGSPVNISGKLYNFVSYGLNCNGLIDYDNIANLAKKYKPKLIIAGASAYSREIDFRCFREIADSVGAYLMVDMAHIAGLVATGLHQSPIPYADVVTSTTHKTLRGPRGGIIITNSEDIIKKVNKAIFPGIQGGPLMHTIAAKAVCFGEALKPEFANYCNNIIKNAKSMEYMFKNNGLNMVSNGTDNHLILLDLRSIGITGLDLEKRLSEVNITVNKNTIPNDTQKPSITSGIRLGTPAITTRGFTSDDCANIANWISDIAIQGSNDINCIKRNVLELCNKYPLPY